MLRATCHIFAAFIFFGSIARAHTPKDGKIHATFGPSIYQTLTSSGEGNSPRYGGALIATGDADYNGGVEIGLFYMDKLYFRKHHGQMLVEKIKRMHISTGYRHWFSKYFSAAGAFYSSYSMGDPQIEHSDVPEGGERFETSAREIVEYGFDVSIQWEMWGTEHVAVLTDLRYSYSLSKKSREDADVYSALLALKYLIPKKS